MKYLVVACKEDKAGINITTHLSQYRQNPVLSSMKQESGFDFHLIEKEGIYTENLDLEKIGQYDFIIFASKHESEKKEKSLSIHPPGNWRDAQLGGEQGKVCPTSALFFKQAFKKLKQNAEEYDLDDYNVTMECTHHGPKINKPCLFFEIGSSIPEWTDRRAGFVVAKTINEIIKEFRPNPYNEIAVGIGGPHYCPVFNKVQLNSNVALSHIIPQYVLPLKDEMIKQAITKTVEEVDFVLVDWKGVGVSEHRQQLIEVLEKNYIAWKRTSEIAKD